MRFKEWFKAQETMTSTSCVAGVPKRWGAGEINRRWWVSDWEEEMSGRKKPNKKTTFVYQLPQVKS